MYSLYVNFGSGKPAHIISLFEVDLVIRQYRIFLPLDLMNYGSNTYLNLRFSLKIPGSILDEQDDRNNVDDNNYKIDQSNIVEEV